MNRIYTANVLLKTDVEIFIPLYEVNMLPEIQRIERLQYWGRRSLLERYSIDGLVQSQYLRIRLSCFFQSYMR